MTNTKALACAAIISAALLSSAAFAQVYKCVDTSGKITFSDQGCASEHSSAKVDIGSINTQDSSQYQQRIREDRLERSRPKQKMQVTVVGDDSSSSRNRMQDKLCREALTPHKGAHGLTASQRSIAASCVSGNFSSSSSYDSNGSSSFPVAPPAPTHITNCDEGGCWDNQGGRYSKGAGSTYFGQDGKSCQNIGGQMQCN